MDVNPSAFTSRAHPCGAVSDMVPGSPVLDVGSLWLLSLCWKDQIQLGMNHIGNISTFIIDMWMGYVDESVGRNVILLSVKTDKLDGEREDLSQKDNNKGCKD